MKNLSDLQPQLLWKHFSALCAIPRPSKKEAQAVSFVKTFAENLGLEHLVDEVGNVIIRKPATAGMENRQGVILQAHLDMVPQKNSDVAHDFEKDPIEAYVDGEWVKARGTTLGADNGIGVAAALAVLESGDVEHGPLEVLFTIDEETGMTGANYLKAGLLKGSIFLNLDTEEESELCIGCAGGLNLLATIDYTEETPDAAAKAWKITLGGLKGGHSGCDIHLGRGNANKIMARLLWTLATKYDLRLSQVEGGNMRNAIPREAQATVTAPASAPVAADTAAFLATLADELNGVEQGITLTAEPTTVPAKVMSRASQKNILATLYAFPNGAMRMIADAPTIVETSSNMAIVRSEAGKLTIACLLRSSVESAKDDLEAQMRALCALTDSKVETSGGYPGWKPNFDSNILHLMKTAHQKLFGREPVVKVIHAGLECGIFGRNYPTLDYISFGPTILHPHSPGEKVDIASVARFWDYLVAVLKTI